MPDFQVPIIPLSTAAQLDEIPTYVEAVYEATKGEYPVGLFLFCIVPEPKWSTEKLEMPPEMTQLLLVVTNPELAVSALDAMKVIEANDAKRLGKQEQTPKPPPKPRGEMSLRQVFKWMDSAPATVVTYTFAGEESAHMVGFLRTKETIKDFMDHFLNQSRANDSLN